MTTIETVPPPAVAPQNRPRYTSIAIHPDALPVVLGALTEAHIGMRRITDGVAGQRRYVTGKPGPLPAPTADREAAAHGLTPREMQVLHGMSRGQSNGAIGRNLYLSEDTIKTHARHLFRKLKVSDRAEAVAVGFRKGLLT